MDSEQTVGREPGGPAASGEEVYRGLRAQILGLDSAGAGLRQGPGHEAVWGALMETGSPRGTASLMGLADGTTSLYLSSGGGIIGGGSHRPGRRPAVPGTAHQFGPHLLRAAAPVADPPMLSRCWPGSAPKAPAGSTCRGGRAIPQRRASPAGDRLVPTAPPLRFSSPANDQPSHPAAPSGLSFDISASANWRSATMPSTISSTEVSAWSPD
jgi:hypothetical protein